MRFRFGLLLGGLLVATSAPASPLRGPPSAPGPASGQGAASAGRAATKVPQCSDRYFWYVPGLVDYCLGSRDWAHGDYGEAIQFFKLAAGWGSKEAQYSLGLIYYNGHHVGVDRARGIAWLELAAERNDPLKKKVAEFAARAATAGQRDRAQRLLSKMRARYADKVAAKRAWKYLEHRLTYKQINSMDPLHQGCVIRPEESPGCQRPGKGESKLDKIIEYYFRGWRGTVTVEPLQPVPAPASSPGH